MAVQCDYIPAIIGGLLIALSSSLNMFLYGKVTGMSGILFQNTSKEVFKFIWQLSFYTGLIFLPCLAKYIFGYNIEFGVDKSFTLFDEGLPSFYNPGAWILAGFLVGVGTKLGNGCTSGHGVCGIPRFSIRSIVSVPTFMLTGMGMATLRYYYPYLEGDADPWFSKDEEEIVSYVLFSVIFAFYIVLFIIMYKKVNFLEHFVSFICGCLFGLGLLIAGMLRISKVLGFLQIRSDWDATLLVVFCTAVGTNLITFYFILKNKPKLADDYKFTKNNKLDWKLIAGAFLFGVGWGLCGLCPGPAMILFVVQPSCFLFFIFLILGQKLVALPELLAKNKQE